MILPQKQVLIILTSFEGKYLKIYPSREKEMTGLLHISDRLLAGELSRVEAARGALHPLPNLVYSYILNSNRFFLVVLSTDRYNEENMICEVFSYALCQH